MNLSKCNEKDMKKKAELEEESSSAFYAYVGG